MKAFGKSFRERLRGFDPFLFVCTTLLSLIGILTLYGIRDATARGPGQLKMQIAATVFGIAAMFLISSFDYETIVDKLWIPLLVIQIAVLGFTLVFGTAEGQNKSWLFIGSVGVQPSEFAKFSYIITFSKHLDLVKDRINRPLPLLSLLAHSGAVIGLILLSGDLGVALVYVGFTAVMMFSAGLHIFYFLGAAGAAVISFPYVWDKLREDQRLRIIYGFEPEKDPLGKGMQPLLGRKCIENGGFFGQGINGGSVYKSLYACENDFAFSSVCEKFGIVCGMAVILLLLAAVVRIYMIGSNSRKDAGSFICAGIAGAIMIQTAENIGMCMARLPVIGITLPFISYGGSSVTAIYLMAGLVHSVHAHRVKYFFERDGR